VINLEFLEYYSSLCCIFENHVTPSQILETYANSLQKIEVEWLSQQTSRRIGSGTGQPSTGPGEHRDCTGNLL
jgi:hypothetical protein